MVTPSVRARRSPWTRGRDWLLVALIAVVVLALGLIVAVNSDHASTDHATAGTPAALPNAPAAVPGSLSELWQARSSATPVPIGEGSTVVTADNGAIEGRDPLTGQVRWHYTRENLALCTAAASGGRVNAVYRKSLGCSEVTQLNPGTGQLTAQRNGDAELSTQLVSDGSHVTTTGKKLLSTWRDDLVKDVEYGQVPAIVNQGKQPRVGCTYGTVAAASSKVGVIEHCPSEQNDRLTVYKALGRHYKGKNHEDEPDVVFSVVTAGKRAHLVAMSGDFAAVALPDQKLLVVYGPDGVPRKAYPLDLHPGELAQDPTGGTVPTTRTNEALYWFTGSKTIALSRDDLSPRWSLEGATGPGITYANQLVVPIKQGFAVLDEATGKTIRTVAADRHGYPGPVRLTALGPLLLEQRGDVVVALR